jgi:iron complex outermembrane receptor protein
MYPETDSSIALRRCALLIAAALPALAHGATPDEALPVVEIRAGAQNSLDRPTATGSNLGLSALETPASVETINREQLVERGDARLTDAFGKATGIHVFPHPGNGGSSLGARGFTDQASVTQLYDGMKQYGTGAVTFPFDTFSVERIEVLRGPASVIYGAGAIGGVVNVVPKKPTRAPLEHELMLAAGSQRTARIGIGSGGALSERLSYRLDASANRSDNWVDRGDSKDATFSGALRYDVSPDLYLTLAHARSDQRPMRYFGVPLIDGAFAPRTFTRNYNVEDASIRYRDTQTTAAVHWTPRAGMSVTSTFHRGSSKRSWHNVEAYTHLPGTASVERGDYTRIGHDQNDIGNTTVITADGTFAGMRNTASGGVEFNRATFGHTNNSPYSGSSIVDIDAPLPGRFIDVAATALKYRVKARQAAAFMEDRLQVNDALSLVAGLRYDRDDVERSDRVTPAASFDKTFNNVGYRLGTVYTVAPSTSLYAQYSVAHDPLGSLLFTNASRAAFDLARGRQVEAGAKQVFWNGKGDWTVAAYRIVKNKLLTRDPTDITRSIQVGQQSSRGIEATVAMRPTPQWQFEGNATLLRAHYDDFQESSGGVAVSRVGNTPADVPERMANLFATWRFAPQWSALASLHYVGERNADTANTLKMPAYAATDLAVSWEVSPATSLTARGFNVFDKRYAQTAYYNSTQWLLGADRRFELQLRHTFR